MKKINLLIISVVIMVTGFSQIPDPLPNTYVNDLAKVLTDEQVHVLNDSILAIEKRSSVQIAIILVNTLPDNISIEDYTLGIGRKWHVGNANNGLVYAASISQHKQRLEVADMLQGDITDATAYNITDNVKPYFRSQDYFGGLQNMLSDINKKIDPVLKQQMALAAIEQEKKDAIFWEGVKTFFMWLFVIIGAVIFSWFAFLRKGYLRRKEEKRLLEQAKTDEEEKQWNKRMNSTYPSYPSSGSRNSGSAYVAPIIVDNSDYGSSPDNSSSSDSGSSSSGSSYGDWGSGSSGSSDSGYSGGGSSNDW